MRVQQPPHARQLPSYHARAPRAPNQCACSTGAARLKNINAHVHREWATQRLPPFRRGRHRVLPDSPPACALRGRYSSGTSSRRSGEPRRPAPLDHRDPPHGRLSLPPIHQGTTSRPTLPRAAERSSRRSHCARGGAIAGSAGRRSWGCEDSAGRRLRRARVRPQTIFDCARGAALQGESLAGFRRDSSPARRTRHRSDGSCAGAGGAPTSEKTESRARSTRENGGGNRGSQRPQRNSSRKQA